MPSPRRWHRGEITPSEADRITGLVEIFVRAIQTSKKNSSRLNLLQILTAGDYDNDNTEDDRNEGSFEESGDYDKADDCN